MDTNEMIGTIILIGVSIIALVKPIINLNTSITELNITIKQLTKDNDEIHNTLENHTDELSDHEARIRILEH